MRALERPASASSTSGRRESPRVARVFLFSPLPLSDMIGALDAAVFVYTRSDKTTKKY